MRFFALSVDRNSLEGGKDGDSMKRASLYGLLVLLALVLLTAAASAEPASGSGWNADNTVYTVIGSDGWGEKFPIDLNDDCTVDLSQASSPPAEIPILFKITGDSIQVTFKTGTEPLNLGSSRLFTVDGSSKNPTVILDAVNITCSSNPANYTFSYPYEGPEPSVLIIQYNGECRVPTFCFSARKNVTTRF